MQFIRTFYGFLVTASIIAMSGLTLTWTIGFIEASQAAGYAQSPPALMALGVLWGAVLFGWYGLLDPKDELGLRGGS